MNAKKITIIKMNCFKEKGNFLSFRPSIYPSIYPRTTVHNKFTIDNLPPL